MPLPFHIVTGGPGSGKTSLIAALAERGIATLPEAGRAVIREEVAAGGHALPWGDRLAFAERMARFDLAALERAEAEAAAAQAAGSAPAPLVFDRGLPDVVGYLRLCGLAVPDWMFRAATERRYARRVFLAPFWPEIYATDTERRQSSDEARRTTEVMVETYTALGYELVALPRSSIAARAAFVLEALA
jgi:predicted ATPase